MTRWKGQGANLDCNNPSFITCFPVIERRLLSHDTVPATISASGVIWCNLCIAKQLQVTLTDICQDFWCLIKLEKADIAFVSVLKMVSEKKGTISVSNVGCFPCSQQGGEQEQGVRRAHARGAHKSGPFCPLCPPNQQGLDDPNSWGLIHQVAP